ncbi:MAG: 2-dehydropantoate 2-reductase [Chloroflexota bacterium]
MKVLVMGAGAIGSVFGGLLAKAGSEVSLVGRGRYMSAVERNGLMLSGIFGEHHVTNLKTFTKVSQIKDRDFDLILITTKAFDTEEAVKEVLPLVGVKTLVISLQNGLGNLEAIARLAGEEHAVGGRVIFGVEMPEVGHAKVTVFGDKVLLGSPSGKIPLERIAEVARLFTEAGIPTEATTEINHYLWGKILYNSCLNALSAILGSNYGVLGKIPETREIMAEVVSEIFAVAKGEGVKLGFANPADYLSLFYSRLLPATAAHHSSMLQDVRQGRKTEIDAMNGIIVKLGEKHGIETPVNRLLTRLVHAREKLPANPPQG